MSSSLFNNTTPEKFFSEDYFNYRTNYITSNIIDSSQLLSIIKDIDSKSFYLGGLHL